MGLSDFKLSFEQHPRYLLAHVSGQEDTLEISVGYWTAIAEECRRTGAENLLVVEDLGTNSSKDDVDALISLLPELGFSDIRIAFVDASEDADLLAYAEFAAHQVGLIGRVFGSQLAAAEWLAS